MNFVQSFYEHFTDSSSNIVNVQDFAVLITRLSDDNHRIVHSLLDLENTIEDVYDALSDKLKVSLSKGASIVDKYKFIEGNKKHDSISYNKFETFSRKLKVLLNILESKAGSNYGHHINSPKVEGARVNDINMIKSKLAYELAKANVYNTAINDIGYDPNASMGDKATTFIKAFDNALREDELLSHDDKAHAFQDAYNEFVDSKGSSIGKLLKFLVSNNILNDSALMELKETDIIPSSGVDYESYTYIKNLKKQGYTKLDPEDIFE